MEMLQFFFCFAYFFFYFKLSLRHCLELNFGRVKFRCSSEVTAGAELSATWGSSQQCMDVCVKFWRLYFFCMFHALWGNFMWYTHRVRWTSPMEEPCSLCLLQGEGGTVRTWAAGSASRHLELGGQGDPSLLVSAALRSAKERAGFEEWNWES